MAFFSLRVVDDEQEAISGAHVILRFTSFLRGMAAEDYTNADGFAHFDGCEEREVEVIKCQEF
jgi:hypothetical protein